MANDLFKKLYNYNELTKEYTLEMALNNFNDFFDDWDASAIRKKDLDPDMVDYLIEAVTELPHKAKIAIEFQLKQKEANPRLESVSQTALDNYFAFKIHLNKRQQFRVIKQAIYYMVLGFTLIFLAFQLEQVLNGLSLNVLSEGLFIGGWVFIWESVSLLFFKSSRLQTELKRYKRILDANIYFTYPNKETF